MGRMILMKTMRIDHVEPTKEITLVCLASSMGADEAVI
jgi:hypothetical protein